MIQASAIEVRAHAKHVSDGLASEIANKILQLLKSEFSALPGTRNQVLLLAQTYPIPTVDASKKNGMWSTSRCIYAYYFNEVLTADEVDFVAENGAKRYRFRVGLEHSEQRVKLGMLTKRQTFCACSSCHVPKFEFAKCKFQALVGRALVGRNPKTQPVRGALPAVMEIAEFSNTLKQGEVRAVDVASDQVEIERAPFWLCRLVGDAFQASAPIVFGDESFEEGYYLVKIQWFEFVDVNAARCRRYLLKPEERMLSVHSFIRCDPVKLTSIDVRHSRSRPSANSVLTLSKDECGKIAERAVIQEFDFDD